MLILKSLNPFASANTSVHIFYFENCEHFLKRTTRLPSGASQWSVLIELTLKHLRYHLTDVPSQPNFPPDNVFRIHTLDDCAII